MNNGSLINARSKKKADTIKYRPFFIRIELLIEQPILKQTYLFLKKSE